MEILLVEDDALIARSLRRGLMAEGFSVTHTGDGREGLALGCSGRFAAVVLDVMLPSLDGFAVCEGLRRAGATVPVLMLTARTDESDETTGLDQGADDYLTKPFSFNVLAARLRALLRRSAARDPANTASWQDPVLRVGDLWLDLDAQRCGRGGTEIELTGQELAVLECLMTDQHQVLSKQSILNRAWDIAYRGGTGIVEVYISLLRRKIDQPFGTHTIHTVRGRGYRVQAP